MRTTTVNMLQQTKILITSPQRDKMFGLGNLAESKASSSVTDRQIKGEKSCTSGQYIQYDIKF